MIELEVVSKNPLYEKMVFELGHEGSLEELQYDRALVERNLIIIDHYISTGKVTFPDIERVINTPETQITYDTMIDALDDGNYGLFDALYRIVANKPKVFCGWLTYFNESLQDALGINLIPEEIREQYGIVIDEEETFE